LDVAGTAMFRVSHERQCSALDMRGGSRSRRIGVFAAGATLVAIAVATWAAPGTAKFVSRFAPTAQQATKAGTPVLLRDVRAAKDVLGSRSPAAPDPIQDYVQPDTQIEPSVAVNPANPLNAVAVYQEGRIADGGDATNGYATTFDGGKTWTYGELPHLTTYPGQGGVLERASDAVVAFGPHNLVYANSLVFDFNANNGLRSGIVVNVSKDGGKSWGPPVYLQDDMVGGLNDKNWIVVDMGQGAGHHFGRVYVVWDRIAPVLVDYCDHDCDRLANWLPDFQTVPNLVFPGQGIGAYPVIQKDGGLGIVMDATSGGVPVPSGPDEIEVQPGTDEIVYLAAPTAGTTPWPAPLTFAPPVDIAVNRTNGTPAQRASDGLPAAAIDPASGNIYVVWDDGRYRADSANDAVISRSFDNGLHWTMPVRINPGSTSDSVNHYGVAVAVGKNGTVHVSYRLRNQSGQGPLYTDQIDTVYQESFDGGASFTRPLKVNRQPSRPWYGAFSRNGTFEGDYDQLASAGGYTYIVRDQGAPAYSGEPAPLVKNPDGSNTVVLTTAGKGHQHQATWVAVLQNQ
jgi:hypothetical protein